MRLRISLSSPLVTCKVNIATGAELGLRRRSEGGEVMAAALVDVDEVRVEAIVGEAEGVKVRPEVSFFSVQLMSKEMCTLS